MATSSKNEEIEMTTPAAEALYLSQHLADWRNSGYAVFNPKDRPVEDLPVIWGFNNGGSPGWYSGVLLADDGKCLGGHICSHEGYMPHDLGVVEGSRPDRHEKFRAHYPEGYRMDFVGAADVRSHPGIEAACKRNDERRQAAEATKAEA